MRKADRILIVAVMLICLLSLIPLFINQKQAAVAVVKVRNEEKLRLNLAENGTWTVKGTLGDVVIEVEDGAVRVTQENSPNHYCSRQGFVSNVNQPIVCLPNETVVVIEGKEESFDTVIS